MYNYVNTLLIAKSTGANTGTTLQTITPGDILFVDGDSGVVLDATGLAALGSNKPLLIAMGIGLGVARLSSPIKRREVTRFIREPYRAPAYQVDTFTPATTAGKTYRLAVVLKDEFRIVSNRQTKIEIPGIVATGVAATDCATIVRQFNKSKLAKGLIVASTNGTTVTLTAQAVPTESIDDYQIVAFNTVFVEEDPTAFNPTLSGGIPRAITTSVKPNPGSGVAVQLKQTEREASGYLGNTDLVNYDRPVLQSRIDPAGTYDLIDIQWFDKHQGDHEFTMESPVRCTIAAVSGSPLSTFVEVQLKAWYNKDDTATTTSTPDPDAPGGE